MSNRTRAHIQHEIDERNGKPICGTCKHHQREDGGWMCCNTRSGYCTDYTEYDDWCDDWESRSVDCAWR